MTALQRNTVSAAAGLIGALLMLVACGQAEPALPQNSAKPVTAAPQAAAPDPVLAARLAQGEELYTRICAVCHGLNGEGYKADAAPALNHPSYLGSVSDALLRDAIANGRTGSTMSAWSKQRGGPLDGADITAVIAFMRSWYTGPKLELDNKQGPGDPTRGGQLYAQHCARCHGTRGIEGPNARIGDPAFLARASTGFLRLAIADGRPPTPMEGFGKLLGPQGVQDVIMHLRTLAATNVAAPAAPPIPEQPLPLPPLPLNAKGKDPNGFLKHPGVTPLAVIAAELKRRKRMAFLDARAPSDYLREHIKGAASVPYYDPAHYFDKLPKDTWLIAYCACPHAESQTLAQKLLDAGFTKVTVLDEGIGSWKAKGHPVESTEGHAPAAPPSVPPAAPRPAH
jgi:mono/diheme cytochrome c family protein/rhodanese-related sulfurtransferase